MDSHIESNKLDHIETTGVKRPGPVKNLRMKAMLRIIRAEANLEMFRQLVRMKVGTNQVEKDALKVVAEGLNRGEGREGPQVSNTTKTEGPSKVNLEERPEKKCLRNQNIVLDMMRIREREVRMHRNILRKEAERERKLYL